MVSKIEHQMENVYNDLKYGQVPIPAILQILNIIYKKKY